MKIAIVSHFLPFPLDAGGKTRLFHLLKSVSGRHSIRFIWLNDGRGKDLSLCRSKFPNVDFQELRAAPGFWSLPYYLLSIFGLGRLFVSASIKRGIDDSVKQWRAEKVQFEFSQSAKFLPSSIKDAILIVHELRWKRMAREAGGPISSLRSWIMRREERSSFEPFKVLVAVSEDDRQDLLRMFPAKRVEMIPNGVDVEGIHPLKRGSNPDKGVFMLGWFGNRQNLEGLRFMAGQVWPKMAARPKVDVFGADLSKEDEDMVKDLGWRYHGYVSEEAISKLVYDSCLVVPLISGGGTRLKVLEAFARGNPVVSTKIGVEGLGVRPNTEALVGDSAESLALSLDKVLGDDKLWTGLSDNARAFVERNYDWRDIAAKNEMLYEG